MIDLLLFSLVCSLWCLGIYRATFAGMILSRVDMIAEKLPDVIYKPLFGCILCMASIHTALIWSLLTIFNQSPVSWLEMLIAIPIVSIINGIIAQIVPE